MSEIKILKEGIIFKDLERILNIFEKKGLFIQKDMYHNGEWLYADVDYNNEIVKKQLDSILLDVEEYRLENNEWFTHEKDKNIIGLSHLVAFCEKEFKTLIKYFKNNNGFNKGYFREVNGYR